MQPGPDPRSQVQVVCSQPGIDGESIMKWFDKLFQNIIVVASLGAGFSFSVVLAPLERINNDRFTVQDVNTAVAVSWLLFVLAVTLCSALSSFFTFHEETLSKNLSEPKCWTHTWMAMCSFTVQALVLGGFLAASVAVAAFSRNVGYLAVALTSLSALGLLLNVVRQYM